MGFYQAFIASIMKLDKIFKHIPLAQIPKNPLISSGASTITVGGHFEFLFLRFGGSGWNSFVRTLLFEPVMVIYVRALPILCGSGASLAVVGHFGWVFVSQ